MPFFMYLELSDMLVFDNTLVVRMSNHLILYKLASVVVGYAFYVLGCNPDGLFLRFMARCGALAV